MERTHAARFDAYEVSPAVKFDMHREPYANAAIARQMLADKHGKEIVWILDGHFPDGTTTPVGEFTRETEALDALYSITGASYPTSGEAILHILGDTEPKLAYREPGVDCEVQAGKFLYITRAGEHVEASFFVATCSDTGDIESRAKRVDDYNEQLASEMDRLELDGDTQIQYVEVHPSPLF